MGNRGEGSVRMAMVGMARAALVPSSPLENKVFKPIFQPAKSWEYFHDFVAVM